MRSTSPFLAALLSICSATAFAGTVQVGGMVAPDGSGKVSNKAGVCTINFNGGSAMNACGATYSNTAPGNFVTGNASGAYAAPVGDTTGYFSVGPASGSQAVTITLAAGTTANYFGFYTGSLDSYNTVSFLLNGVQVDSFTGSQINLQAFGTAATGNQGQAVYIDYFPTSLYNSIVYMSTADAFESDNHAIGNASLTVPEPGILALLGLGALMMRRRRAV